MSLSNRRHKGTKFSPEAKSSILSLSLVLIFTVFGFVIFNVCSDRQAQFEAKLAELDEVNHRVHELNFVNTRLEERVVLLKTDLGVEEVAREKLGLVKPGELAYAVVPPPPPHFVVTEDLSLRYGEKEIKEVDKDRGTVIRILRHLFGPTKPEQQVSSQKDEKTALPGA